MDRVVEFEPIEQREVKFGNNNFIEVSKKRAVSEDGENIFFSLSRGFYSREGEKRYKKNFSIPDDGRTLEAILEAFEDILEEAGQAEPEEPEEPEEPDREEIEIESGDGQTTLG